MPTPDFVTRLREYVGHDLLWLSSATGVVLDEGGRVLLGRRTDSGNWALPGGIVDPAESPADAVIREIFEETGVIAVPERVIAVTVLEPFSYRNGDQVQYLDVAFRCRAVGGEARVNDAESVEVGWHALDSLPEVSERTIGFLSQATSNNAAAAFGFSGLSAVLGIADCGTGRMP
jgi:8-oxo-dGTP pyrophosphatase MutT (NUDIX family)